MKYFIIQSAKRLKPFIRLFRAFENEFDNKSCVYRLMADGCVEMIFYYKGAFDKVEQGNIFGVENNKQSLSLVHAQ